MVVVMYFLIKCTIGDVTFASGYDYLGIFFATLFGLGAGLSIGLITEHYTGTGTGPVKSVADQTITGSATNIIAG